MHRYLAVVPVLLGCAAAVQAQGILVPEDKNAPPLALAKHHVSIVLEDQIATTQVEQVFQNAADRPVEATYLFPVPRGASVNQFCMWVDGKKMTGELLQADKARQTYTDIVRRTQDPGLLEYVDSNLMRLRIFPVPAHGEQKISVRFTSMATLDGAAVSYVYPLRNDAKIAKTLKEIALTAAIKSQHGVQNVYSPSHRITLHRVSDNEVTVGFEQTEAVLDKDFQLFYAPGNKDVAVSALMHRPIVGEDGQFLLLLSPRIDLVKTQVVPRDVVLVLDTSGSMEGKKIDQARKALKHCLTRLNASDRFALIGFATTVDKYRNQLLDASQKNIDAAQRWVDRLEANGSTAIHDAFIAALDMRSADTRRSFTVVFFTDGQPNIGELDPEKIVKSVLAKSASNTRIFTFGVGDDVNAVMLDQVAERTRGVSTYVRPSEDIEAKVSSLYAKISHPVLTDLKLTVESVAGRVPVHINDVYPPQLPDLFHGGQLVVLGRYHGAGKAKIILRGSTGDEHKEFTYETRFPTKTSEEKAFVDELWARRKVGYLLDQVRANGTSKEVVDEVTKLARKHRIATPYTSYLVAPDLPVAQARSSQGAAPITVGSSRGIIDADGSIASELAPTITPDQFATTGEGESFATAAPNVIGDLLSVGHGSAAAAMRAYEFKIAENESPRPGSIVSYNYFGNARPATPCPVTTTLSLAPVAPTPSLLVATPAPALSVAARSLAALQTGNHSGTAGVELSIALNALRNQEQIEPGRGRRVAGRNCFQVNGIWVDETLTSSMPQIVVKAMSAAYFRILERQPVMKDVFRLGTSLVWVTPSGTALIISPNDGTETMADAEIDRLFAAK